MIDDEEKSNLKDHGVAVFGQKIMFPSLLGTFFNLSTIPFSGLGKEKMVK